MTLLLQCYEKYETVLYSGYSATSTMLYGDHVRIAMPVGSTMFLKWCSSIIVKIIATVGLLISMFEPWHQCHACGPLTVHF